MPGGTPAPGPARELCAAGARRVGEPLFATASRVDLWLVLEVPGAWGSEVGDSLDPDGPMGRALLPVLKTVPRSRVLFIKGGGRGRRETVAFYVAVTDEADSRLYRFELGSYEALEGIDLFGVLAEEERYDAHRETRPLYLVCTHGTHDRCCAKFGFPVYTRLARERPESVWQSSHVGGDRFAANVVCLPDGLYYGQVDTEEAGAILEHTEAGRICLSPWRGRTCYPPPVQAAEYYLRRTQEEHSVAAYRIQAHRSLGGDTEASFLAVESGLLHTVRVETVLLEGMRSMTCGTGEPKPVRGYRLLEHRSDPFQPEMLLAGAAEYGLHPAAMRDYGFIYRLRHETLRRYLDEIGMAPEEQCLFCARFDVTRHRLVSLGETPVGAVSVVEREEGLHLANLHFLPEYQGRGLGTAVVRELQSRAEHGGQRVTTQVLKVNPARAFYERLGFRIEGEQGLRYRMAWEP